MKFLLKASYVRSVAAVCAVHDGAAWSVDEAVAWFKALHKVDNYVRTGLDALKIVERCHPDKWAETVADEGFSHDYETSEGYWHFSALRVE